MAVLAGQEQLEAMPPWLVLEPGQAVHAPPSARKSLAHSEEGREVCTVEPPLKETPNKAQDSEHQNFTFLYIIVLTHL